MIIILKNFDRIRIALLLYIKTKPNGPVQSSFSTVPVSRRNYSLPSFGNAKVESFFVFAKYILKKDQNTFAKPQNPMSIASNQASLPCGVVQRQNKFQHPATHQHK